MANVLANIGGGEELLEHGIRYVQVGAPEPDKLKNFRRISKRRDFKLLD